MERRRKTKKVRRASEQGNCTAMESGKPLRESEAEHAFACVPEEWECVSGERRGAVTAGY